MFYLKYFISAVMVIGVLNSCGDKKNTERTDNPGDTTGLNEKIEYKVIYEDIDNNQYVADIYLPEFNRINGGKVLNQLIRKLKNDNYGALHVTFWDREFTKEQIENYYTDKFRPPKGTKNFLCNYGFNKGFKEVQQVFEF
jgi:hypothetical protein